MQWGLALWAVGVQVNEGLASAGALLTTFAAALDAGLSGAFARPAAVLRSWWPLGALLGWSLLLAPLLAQAAPSGSGAARLIDNLGVPAAAWAAFRLGARRLAPVGAAAGAVLLASCALAALQHLGVWPERAWFGWLEWTRVPFDRVYEPAPGAPGRFLAGGLLFHRLRFAHVTALFALLALAVALRAYGPGRRFAGAVALVGLASVAVFPGARAAFVAALLAGALLAVLLAPSKKAALARAGAVALAGAVLFAASPALRARLFASVSREGSGDRAGLLRAGAAAVAAHPLAGIGPGRFRAADWAPADASALAREHGGKTHNLLLTAAAETGVPGALLMASWLFFLARGYWRRGREARAGLAVLALLLLLGVLHDPLFHAEVSLAFALALGLCWGQAREVEPAAGAGTQASPGAGAPAAARRIATALP